MMNLSANFLNKVGDQVINNFIDLDFLKFDP